MVCHGSHQYTPFMLAYIPAPWVLWVLEWHDIRSNPIADDAINSSQQLRQDFTKISTRGPFLQTVPSSVPWPRQQNWGNIHETMGNIWKTRETQWKIISRGTIILHRIRHVVFFPMILSTKPLNGTFLSAAIYRLHRGRYEISWIGMINSSLSHISQHLHHLVMDLWYSDLVQWPGTAMDAGLKNCSFAASPKTMTMVELVAPSSRWRKCPDLWNARKIIRMYLPRKQPFHDILCIAWPDKIV